MKCPYCQKDNIDKDKEHSTCEIQGMTVIGCPKYPKNQNSILTNGSLWNKYIADLSHLKSYTKNLIDEGIDELDSVSNRGKQ
jgi:hypothetical protein